MIVDGTFTIDMSNARRTRVHYRTLSTTAIFDLIAINEQQRALHLTDEERDEAEFALQELRAVLQERR